MLDCERHRVVLANAGHPLPLLRRPDGAVEQIAGAGVPLGVSGSASLQAPDVTLSMDPGSSLLLYTDGLVEAHDGDREERAARRLHELLSRHGGSARAAGRAIVAALVAGGDGRRDDTTLVCLARLT